MIREMPMMIRPLAAAAALALALLAAPALAQTPGPAAPPQPMFKGGKYVMQDGEAIFTHLCQGCHMPDAKGATGAGTYPALAGDPRLAAKQYPIMVIVKGQKGMPPFGAYFDDAQVASVVNYVRSHFGNHFAGEATAADVAAMRR